MNTHDRNSLLLIAAIITIVIVGTVLALSLVGAK